MKGKNFKAVTHPFEEDLTQIVNDWSVTKPTPPFKLNEDGYLYVFAGGQSNMVGRQPYTNPDGFIENYTPITEIPDGAGGWTTAVFGVTPIFNNRYNIALFVCDQITKKYGVKCRLVLSSVSGSSIVDWADTLSVEYQKLEGIANTLGSNFKECGLWLWSQGEQDITMDYATYFPYWNTLRSNLISDGYLASDHNFICNEVSQFGSASTVNTALETICDNDVRYGFVKSDGVTKFDSVHWDSSPRGVVQLSRRYSSKLEEVLFSFTPKTETARPSAPTVTLNSTSADSVNISWTASTPDTGLSIVSYFVYSDVNGFIYYKQVNSSTLSLDVDFKVLSGEVERFTVLAFDSNGNYNFWDQASRVSSTRP